jgi:hypothetical protein
MGILAAAGLVSVAWASDAWKDKKPADWTQKQMDKFLTSSPWANTVQPSSNMPMPSGSPGGPGGGGWGGGGGGGGMGGGGGRGGGGGGGSMGGAMPIMTFQIRWLSAPVMREALKVVETDQFNAEIQKYANDYYIIGVQMQVQGGAGGSGPRGGGRASLGSVGGGQGAAPGAGQGQGAGNEKMQSRWQQFQSMPTQGAFLKFGRQEVHPEKAEIGPCKTGMMTLYMFPRSLKLEDASKDYLFEVTQGQSTTRASFSLKGLEEAPDKGL